jgi:hypothetical protein
VQTRLLLFFVALPILTAASGWVLNPSANKALFGGIPVGGIPEKLTARQVSGGVGGGFSCFVVPSSTLKTAAS